MRVSLVVLLDLLLGSGLLWALLRSVQTWDRNPCCVALTRFFLRSLCNVVVSSCCCSSEVAVMDDHGFQRRLGGKERSLSKIEGFPMMGWVVCWRRIAVRVKRQCWIILISGWLSWWTLFEDDGQTKKEAPLPNHFNGVLE